MRKHKEIERNVRSLLLTILSRKTQNAGAVKTRTVRSPIGMRGIAVRQAKLVVEIENPYNTSQV